jgi:hypothetical protein
MGKVAASGTHGESGLNHRFRCNARALLAAGRCDYASPLTANRVRMATVVSGANGKGGAKWLTICGDNLSDYGSASIVDARKHEDSSQQIQFQVWARFLR